MLVIHDDTGFISQIIMIGDFQALQKIYQSNGHNTVLVDQVSDLTDSYVKNGAITIRPQPQVTGAIRPMKANGVDSLHFDISPANFTLNVRLDGVTVHSESDTTGSLDFVVTHPGTYSLFVSAAFPYSPATLIIEAT